MRRRRLAPVLAALLVGSVVAVPAAAQDGPPEPVVDVWYESFQAGRKLGWSHVRVREDPGAPDDGRRFELTETFTWPLEDGTARYRRRTGADARGRILECELVVEAGPRHARSWLDGVPDGGHYWRTEREGGPRDEGRFPLPVVEEALLPLLVARGVRTDGETIRVDRLPRAAPEPATLHVTELASGELRLVVEKAHDRTEYLCAGDGRVIEGRGPQPGTSFRTVPREDARDMSREGPEETDVPGLGPGGWSAPGRDLSVGLPGQGWMLHVTDGNPPDVYLYHASDATILVREGPPVPEEGRARLELGERQVRSSEEGRQGWHLAAPRASWFRGRRAVEFEVGGVIRGVPVSGWAWLVEAGDAGRYLVAFAPEHLRMDLEGLLEEGMEAVDLPTR